MEQKTTPVLKGGSDPNGIRGLPPYLIIAGLTVLCSIGLFSVVSHVRMMPEAASYEATWVDQAFDGLLKLTIPIFSLVLMTLLFSVVRFRTRPGRPHEEGVRFDRSRGEFVEVLWIAISLVLTVGLAAFGAKEFRLIRGTDQADVDIQVNSSQWSWEFFYPSYNQYASSLILPEGKRVRLLLTSKDVVHSFWVPEFRVKQDALPGKVVKLLFTPSKTGTYQLLCAELCGTEHTIMTARVNVVDAKAFEATMKEESWEGR
ncbi:MAG: cytochrome c oxidase subunit II [Elusimicrobia bacterium]|nr:cytochrome c oxidase subunit II [Elusimicrobiota bacterium]